MNRLPLLLASLALGVATVGGGVAAQETPSETVANGGYSVADPSNPIVADEGDVRIYGEIATGNSRGEVVGDPAALASIQSHDTIANSVLPPDLTPDDDPGLVPSSGVAAAPAEGTTTDGTTTGEPVPTTGVPVQTTGEPIPTSGEPVQTTGEAAPVTGDPASTTTDTAAAATYCDAYVGWYDAQVAYEAAGGVGGDPALVQAADPDYDGVACEHLIVY